MVPLVLEVRISLHEVRAPPLVIPAGNDGAIEPRSGKFHYEGIISSMNKIHITEDAPHMIPF
jgi:esterase/lipase